MIASIAVVLAGCSTSGTTVPTFTPPPTSTVPNLIDYGFGTILISQDIAANTAATVVTDVFTVDVPDNAFTTPVTFEILLGDPHAYDDSVPQGQLPILAFAFQVIETETGQLVGKFANPIQLTIYDPRVVPNSDYFNVSPNQTLTQNPTGLILTDGELRHPIAGAEVGWVVSVPE